VQNPQISAIVGRCCIRSHQPTNAHRVCSVCFHCCQYWWCHQIYKSNKSSPFDILPTSLLKSCCNICTYSCIQTASTPSEIISHRVCGILLGIGEGANVVISTKVIRLDSPLLRLCNWSILMWTVLHCYRKVICIVSRWPFLADWASFPPPQLTQIDLSVLTCR